jgi:hypothetical protein
MREAIVKEQPRTVVRIDCGTKVIIDQCLRSVFHNEKTIH